jgi:tRNA(His) 5'-end guanylyltransferase
MKSDEFGSELRGLEWFHNLKALPGTWPIIRVDGRSFSKLTEVGFEKPFDERLHQCMTATASALLIELAGVYAYTESDEISILMPISANLFDRKVEKLVSVSAGVASSIFTHEVGSPAHFDSRLSLCAAGRQVVDYFRWRQADAARCCLNGWCYWMLRNDGMSAAQATERLKGVGFDDKNELLFQRGVNFNDLPVWQKRGTGVFWEEYERIGYDPIAQERVKAIRRRVKIDRNIPKGDDYGIFIQELLGDGSSG